ncbi:hypothetical protein OFO94_31345, partial [Escherichia coli]|nr:hypothetical protein [Escherichia coli]
LLGIFINNQSHAPMHLGSDHDIDSTITAPDSPHNTYTYFPTLQKKKARGYASRKLLHDDSREQLIEL